MDIEGLTETGGVAWRSVREFKERFSTRLAPRYFLRELKAVHPGLDARFDLIDWNWKIISWVGAKGWSRWREVQASTGNFERDLESLRRNARMTARRLIAELKASQAKRERDRDSTMEPMFHEMAKDIRKPLLYDHDGLTNDWRGYT